MIMRVFTGWGCRVIQQAPGYPSIFLYKRIQMREQQLFRVTLILTVLCFLVIGGASINYYIEANSYETENEKVMVYQNKMAITCKSNPNFPACISDEEYVVLRLTAIKNQMEAMQIASQLKFLAILLPIIPAISFYLIRWGLTGRIRPLWILKRGRLG